MNENLKFTFTGDPKAAPSVARIVDRTENHIIVDFETVSKKVSFLGGGTKIHLNIFVNGFEDIPLYSPCQIIFEGFDPSEWWCCSLGYINKDTNMVDWRSVNTATFRRVGYNEED